MKGDHHVANEIIGACGLKRVCVLNHGAHAWRGSVWTTGSYDPSLNLLFWGTGGPIPHTELVRGTADGAVLYTDSTLALDADTGKIVWHHQFLPRDNWNLDHVFEQILVDINVGDRPRQALLAI